MLIQLTQWLDKFWRKTLIGKTNLELNHERASELRAKQIHAVIALGPLMMLANLINVAIIDYLFWHTRHQHFLVIWTLVIVGGLTFWGKDAWFGNKRPIRPHVSTRGTMRVSLNSLIFGLAWATPMIFMFRDVSEAQRVVLATATAGMISGGALALTTVWQAALLYSLSLELPTLVILVSTGNDMYIGLAALSITFALMIGRSVNVQSRMFVESFITSVNQREQGQVISLLLKEFEENSSDWLFEVDAQGCFERVSARFANILGQPAEAINGTKAMKLLQSNLATEQTRRDTNLLRLNRAFENKLAFRDILVQVKIGLEWRWWSLTAKPIFDASGTFTGYRGVGSDITATKRAEASVQHMAQYDALTGLPNRSFLHARLVECLNKLRAEGAGFAVISMDLDRFKNVNDTLGHPVGDALLVQAAQRVSALLRDTDIVARFGGDEFVILQTNLRSSADAAALAERLVSAVGAPYEINGQRMLIGASVGVALAPENGDDADDLLRNSDLALYRAKADGKGRFRFFAAEMDSAMQSRRLIELDLREAIENQRLEVYFQPLLEMETGTISACEALVRWNHPTRGAIPPKDFIPIAEDTGLIVAIGQFVLLHACTIAADWERDIRISVNLSAVQFRAGNLTEMVAEVLAKTGLPAARLELEITESILIEDKDEVLATLNSLRDLGVRIAIDDFGTGYSSLAYLSSFPFDKIKIDRSFVQDVASRPDSAAIIRAITSLASTLGMCTTAEGVENLDELDWLRDHGCKEVQGYLFSSPVPAKDIELMLGLKGAHKNMRTQAERAA
ncbi:MAG: EAL domain-containing protein [Hyphomicrobiales bacterium]|nr:EAL domain-containing protein [Hyphomicrobiales bacterium]MDE2113883.1 EAL domain-containing protein [Hyphomicrobiales bacterium]